MGVSIPPTDEAIHAALEPGTPTPRARLELVRAIVDAGLPCQVLVAPILPMITDSDEQLDATLSEFAAAGACGATVFALICVLVARVVHALLFRYQPNSSTRTPSCTAKAPTSPAATPLTWPKDHRWCFVNTAWTAKTPCCEYRTRRRHRSRPHLALTEPSLFR